MVQLKELSISWTPALNFSERDRERLRRRGVLLGIGGENAVITNQSVINLFVEYDRRNNKPAPIDVVKAYIRSALDDKPKPQVNERRIKEFDGPDLEL